VRRRATEALASDGGFRVSQEAKGTSTHGRGDLADWGRSVYMQRGIIENRFYIKAITGDQWSIIQRGKEQVKRYKEVTKV
jgi:hypothetical protein